MISAATPTTVAESHISEVLEVAFRILEREHDEHLARKTLIMQGLLEMSQRYPERDYRTTLKRALADVIDALHLRLNGELRAPASQWDGSYEGNPTPPMAQGFQLWIQ